MRNSNAKSCFDSVDLVLDSSSLRNRHVDYCYHRYRCQSSYRPHHCGVETVLLLRIVQMLALFSNLALEVLVEWLYCHLVTQSGHPFTQKLMESFFVHLSFTLGHLYLVSSQTMPSTILFHLLLSSPSKFDLQQVSISVWSLGRCVARLDAAESSRWLFWTEYHPKHRIFSSVGFISIQLHVYIIFFLP